MQHSSKRLIEKCIREERVKKLAHEWKAKAPPKEMDGNLFPPSISLKGAKALIFPRKLLQSSSSSVNCQNAWIWHGVIFKSDFIDVSMYHGNQNIVVYSYSQSHTQRETRRGKNHITTFLI
ncbi:hypothetical protein RCL_jg2316.t1 [Rhizophagus clarus]|uniref:Uncharacterized protein n=1 Tax=Rhizophagus clarus TaxID=94130 RepID=A0A8H3KR17_9GLOM|nr:hypothetical protein RCL_jg2316.t1 [Rhizophagus clarus]